MFTSPVNKEKYEIPLEEIMTATNNLNPKNKIGEGGFGEVYVGKVSNFTAAIKRNDKKSKQGRPEFENELELVMRIHHQNIIPFIGYCDQDKELILVYEYADNGSLDTHIKDPRKRRSLSWVQRLKICLGAARAINHLHTGLGEHNSVIHRDVKSSNILLDDKWEAKVCDFGFSRSRPEDEKKSQWFTEFAGTDGYIDPVYQVSSMLQKESDVYSFGVVLFEMLSGLLASQTRSIEVGNPQYLISLVRRFYNDRLDRLIDPDIRDQMYIHSLEYIETTSFHTIKEIAYQCIRLDRPEKRPTMGRIIQEIEEALDIQEKNHYLMEYIINDKGFSRGKPVAAFCIYKYFLHWKSFEDENSRVFSRIIKMINLAIEKRNSNDYTAYWLSSALALLFLIQGILKYDDPSSAAFRSSSSSVTIVKALAASTLEVKDPVIDFKQELTLYLAKLCCTIREKLKYDLGVLLTKVIQDPHTSRRGLKSDNWQNIVNYLSNTLGNTFKENFVPPRIVRMIFDEIFIYINVTLFNSIFEHPECCTLSNAKYLKAGLYKLDEWCSQYLGAASEKLMHLRQAVDFLFFIKDYSHETDVGIEHIGDLLSLQQLEKICKVYREENGSRGKAIHVISWLKELKANNEEGSLLLEDNPSETFAIDDFLTSHRVTLFSGTKRDTLLAKYPAFHSIP